MKQSSIDRARNVDDKLTFNMDLIISSKLEVKAGQDDRKKNLHPCRFLPAPVCTAKELWLHAREVLGPAGLLPGSCFNMADFGLTAMSPAVAGSRSTTRVRLSVPPPI
jgi:hypothetical protein